MGFERVARHRSKDVDLYRQGDINFIVNREPRSLAGYFAAEHGPGPCAMAFRVRDVTRVVPEVMRRVAAAGLEVRELEVRESSLEEAFLRLTRDTEARP